MLSELPARVVVFLRAIGTHAGIRNALAQGGFGQREHEEGFSLLEAACAWDASEPYPREGDAARQASPEIEAWVRTHFERLGAAVTRSFPEHTDLFQPEVTSTERLAASKLAVLLERLDRLDEGAHGEGGAVSELLARRGLDRAERARLKALVERAARAEPQRGQIPQRTARESELIRLYQWYVDWAASARAFITRKDWLVVLGLSGRSRPISHDKPER